MSGAAPADGIPDSHERHARLNALSPLQQDELCHIIGQAAIDLWVHGESWPNIVDRCLEAIEEDDDDTRVFVHRSAA